MSHAYWFNTPLRCLNCCALTDGKETRLHTAGLKAEAIDGWALPGEEINSYLGDFEDAFFRLRDPGSQPEVRCLEEWSCPVCKATQWARLVFRREAADTFRFMSAESVPLTPEAICDMHYLSRGLADWMASNPGKETDALAKKIGPALQ